MEVRESWPRRVGDAGRRRWQGGSRRGSGGGRAAQGEAGLARLWRQLGERPSGRGGREVQSGGAAWSNSAPGRLGSGGASGSNSGPGRLGSGGAARLEPEARGVTAAGEGRGDFGGGSNSETHRRRRAMTAALDEPAAVRWQAGRGGATCRGRDNAGFEASGEVARRGFGHGGGSQRWKWPGGVSHGSRPARRVVAARPRQGQRFGAEVETSAATVAGACQRVNDGAGWRRLGSGGGAGWLAVK